MNKIDSAVEYLKHFGFVRVDGVMSTANCDQLASALDEIQALREAAGTVYSPGGQVVVYDPAVERPDLFLPTIEIPTILSIVEALLGADFILGSVAGSKSGPDVGTFGAHIDGSLAIRDIEDTTNVQMAICLDEFTETNGATRVWPLSHTSGTRIQNAKWRDTLPAATPLTASKGSLVVFLGQTWHKIGANVDGSRRWGLLLNYHKWWIKPTFDFTQCGSEIYSKLSVTQKRLFGFNSRPPRSGQKRINTLTKAEDLPGDYKEALRV